MDTSQLNILIMAGGSGTRFWPRSRKRFPKQYLNLFGKKSLVQETTDRMLGLVSQDQVFICSASAQKPLLKEQLPHIKGLILEPEGKNTAPCLMLSVIHLLRQGASLDSVMVVLPADHYIAEIQTFLELLKLASQYAVDSKGLITLGICPTHPHTGYGYIESGSPTNTDGVFHVKRFVEKPTLDKAKEFINQGNFYWNGGIFVWTLGAIVEAFKKYMFEDWNKLNQFNNKQDLTEIYGTLNSTAIDTGILEKASNRFVIPASMGWNDVGSWSALFDLHPLNDDGHISMSGHIESEQSYGCLVDTPNIKNIALVGVKDLIIVEDHDTLLIAHRDHDQSVKKMANKFDV